MLIVRHLDNPFSDNCYTKAITENYNKWFIDNQYLFEYSDKKSILSNYEFKALLRSISVSVDLKTITEQQLNEILSIYNTLVEVYGFNRTIQHLEILLKQDTNQTFYKLLSDSNNSYINSLCKGDANVRKNLEKLVNCLTILAKNNELDVIENIHNGDKSRVVGNIFVAKAVFGYRDNDAPQIAVNISDTRTVDAIASDYSAEIEQTEPQRLTVDF